jgi:hypothetical protein
VRIAARCPPSYTHKTKTVHKHITKYRDVHRTKYFKRIKPIIHVTRIQPVVHVHKVTRVHTPARRRALPGASPRDEVAAAPVSRDEQRRVPAAALRLLLRL